MERESSKSQILERPTIQTVHESSLNFYTHFYITVQFAMFDSRRFRQAYRRRTQAYGKKKGEQKTYRILTAFLLYCVGWQSKQLRKAAKTAQPENPV